MKARKIKMYPAKFGNCIVINSLAYFIIAYYFVVFTENLTTISLAKIYGFKADLFYHGFKLYGAKWTNDKIILVYFFGNIVSLVVAFIFRALYKKERRHRHIKKVFFLWVYIIALSWFLGNVISGALFLSGMGAVTIAFRVPFMFRSLLAFLAIVFLFYLGYKAQKHVRVMGNMYFSSIRNNNIYYFFYRQILYPLIIGIVIIILMKIPHLDEYHYIDLYMIFSVVFFVAGLFYKLGKNKPLYFKNTDENSELNKETKGYHCHISSISLVLMVLVLVIIRIGLGWGVTI